MFRARLARWIVLLGSTSFILAGCDPGIRSTVENGIISVSNAALLALFQAGIQLFQEAQTTTQ